MTSLQEKIFSRLQRKGKGFAFTAKDFLDLGKRGAVDVALSSMAKTGQIRRVCRGVYDYPKHSELLDELLAPDFDQVAHAIARNTGARILPSGAVAANLLGLSQQVPAKIIYLTDGLSRTISFGAQSITFKRTRPRDLFPDQTSALVLQALLFLGKEAMTEALTQKIRKILSPIERKRLLKTAKYASDWVAEIARKITQEPSNG